ncbi:MAG: SDR family oxidoreductase, partial [Mesorhizobium sp.]
MIDFSGRSVVVTGAAGGVGSALVAVLSACRAR